MVLYYLKCRHRQALPDSTESSLLVKQDTWIFLMTVLLFKLVFSFKNNAQHLTFVTVCETDFFFFPSEALNLFNFRIYYTCFWKQPFSYCTSKPLPLFPSVAVSVIGGTAVILCRTYFIFKYCRVIKLLHNY